MSGEVTKDDKKDLSKYYYLLILNRGLGRRS